MLAVEERLGRGELPRMVLHVFLDRRLETGPLRADEGVALHLAPPDDLPLLPEEALPGLLRVVFVADALGTQLLRREVLPTPAPGVDVVVARGDHQLHLASVGGVSARKHLVPDGRELLHFANQARVRDVAGAQHGVHVLRREPPQRLFERRLRVRLAADVHIAHRAETQPGRDALLRVRACRAKARPPRRTERQHPADKLAPRHVKHM